MNLGVVMEEDAQHLVEITEGVEVEINEEVEIDISAKENNMAVGATIMTERVSATEVEMEVGVMIMTGIVAAIEVEMEGVILEEVVDDTIMIEEETIEAEMAEVIVDRKTKAPIEDTAVVIITEMINLEIKCLADQIVRGLHMMISIGFR